MTSTLKGRGEGGKNEMLSEVGGGGLASVLDVQSSFFLLKKIAFASWPDIMLNNILLERNLPFDSDVR